MDYYEVMLAIVGAVTLGASVLPLLIVGRPLSFPMVYVALGVVVFSLPLELPRADPVAYGPFVERISELAVIVALMGTVGTAAPRRPRWGRCSGGRSADRPGSWRRRS